MSTKKFFLGLALSAVLVAPALVSAQTTNQQILQQIEEIKAKIAALLVEIANLQGQNSSAGIQSGDKVKSLVTLNVRSAPSTTGTVISKVSIGSTGTVDCSGNQQCSVNANGLWWYYIVWDSKANLAGWSAVGSSETSYLAEVEGTGNTTTFTQTGYGRINATYNGATWEGPVTVSYETPSGNEGTALLDLPALYPNNVFTGNYAFSYASGGPSGAQFSSISISNGAQCGTGCGSLTTNNTLNNPLTFTFNFTSAASSTETGYGRINVMKDGSPWEGQIRVSYETPSGNEGTAFITAPANYLNNVFVGQYRFGYVSGGPEGTTFSGISVTNGTSCGTGCGALTTGNTSGNPLTYTFNFTTSTAQSGHGHIKATRSNGTTWSGPITLNYESPYGSGQAQLTLPIDYPNQTFGNYSFSYVSGGPGGTPTISVTGGSSCGTGCGVLSASNTAGNPLLFNFHFPQSVN